MILKTTMKALASLIISTILVACGGGSGGGDSAPQKIKVQRLVSESSSYPRFQSNFELQTFSLALNFYDEKGRLIKKDVDRDADGMIDKTVDTSPDSFYSYTYNEQGLLLTRSFKYYSQPEHTYLIETFNENGDVVKKVLDNISNGVGIDNVTTDVYTYDELGRKLTIERDLLGQDGVADVFFFYTYEENKVVEELDTLPGFSDAFTIYNYNDSGDLIRTDEVDENLVLQMSRYFTSYTYDDNGNLVTKKIDFFNDGRVVEIINYIWEEFEILVN